MKTRPNLTRRFYERAPYPPPRHPTTKRWRLPPLEWVLAIDRPRSLAPRRVLVAGCGTGSEAFLLRGILGGAEIVGVDFSPRSIQIARQTQLRTPASRRIRFVVADLADPQLARKLGGPFDLIACHGVLSYVARPEAVLGNLRRCLSPDGLLVLGVNGASHFSVPLRRVMVRLGIDIAEMPRDDRWRGLIKMWEVLSGGTQTGVKSRLPRWYLGGDFFGPVLHNLSLREWSELFRRSGLFLRASFSAHRALRAVVNSEVTPLMMPCSRAELCELLDVMHPLGFHRLIVTRRPTPTPPWRSLTRLLSWRPAATGLFIARLPRRAKRTGFSRVVIKSRSLNTQFEWPMARWGIEVLRGCNGTKSLRQLVKESGSTAPRAEVPELLFLLHQFGVLNLFPPV